MPEMDGLTAMGIIRNELQSQIPIIALTARALKGDDDECFNAGASSYVSKPVNSDELFEEIKKLLFDQESLLKAS